MKQQNELINEATRDFVSTLCRINLYNAVADMFLGRSVNSKKSKS
jgi:hypothetical protein